MTSETTESFSMVAIFQRVATIINQRTRAVNFAIGMATTSKIVAL